MLLRRYLVCHCNKYSMVWLHPTTISGNFPHHTVNCPTTSDEPWTNLISDVLRQVQKYETQYSGTQMVQKYEEKKDT